VKASAFTRGLLADPQHNAGANHLTVLPLSPLICGDIGEKAKSIRARSIIQQFSGVVLVNTIGSQSFVANRRGSEGVESRNMEIWCLNA
jgi:hypothetical protein